MFVEIFFICVFYALEFSIVFGLVTFTISRRFTFTTKEYVCVHARVSVSSPQTKASEGR